MPRAACRHFHLVFTLHREKAKKYISKAATNFTCSYFGQPALRCLPSCQASSPTFAGELSSGPGHPSHILDFQGHRRFSFFPERVRCISRSVPVRKSKLSKRGWCPACTSDTSWLVTRAALGKEQLAHLAARLWGWCGARHGCRD